MKEQQAWYFGNKQLCLGYNDGRWILPNHPITIAGQPIPCSHGLHASKSILDALSFDKGTVVHRVVLSGTIVEGGDKLCATERTHLWWLDIEDVLKEWSLECAWRALPKYEKEYPNDNRVRKCLEMTRLYLDGKSSKGELKTARFAAARSADAFARSAAAFAADAAADAAAYAADAFARSADAFARSAASAAWSVERKWQEERLIQMIEKEKRRQI